MHDQSNTTEVTYAYLVINPGGGEAKGYAMEAQANAFAKPQGHIVVKVPVVADYRQGQ